MTPKKPKAITVGELHANIVQSRYREKDQRWYWRCEVREDGVKVTKWCGWATPREATDALKALDAGDDPSDSSDDTCRTLRDLLEMWTAAVEARSDLAAQTIYTEVRAAERVAQDAIIGTRIDRLDRRSLEGYRDRRLRAKAAPSTVRLDMVAIRAAWNWGREIGLVDDHDLPSVPVRGGPVRAKTTPTTEQIDTLLAQVAEEQPWLQVAVDILVETGARRNEVAGLRWRDVAADGGWVEFRGKGWEHDEKKIRRVPLSDELADHLEAHRGHDDTGIFGVAPRTVTNRLNAIITGAFTPHGLRRAMVDRLYATIPDPSVSAAMLGHSPEIAMREYRKPRAVQLRSAMEQVRAAMDAEREATRKAAEEAAHNPGAQVVNIDGWRRK